jgi:hypothetical protein
MSTTITINNVIYTLSSGTSTASITGNTFPTNYVGPLLLESSVTNGGTTYTVTNISANVFKSTNLYTFTGNLILPTSLIEIQKGAFQDCSSFTGTLIIPDTVTIIHQDAFHNCSGFSNPLIIPASVRTIDKTAFVSTPNFTNVIIENQSAITVDTTSFTNVSGTQGSTITFYLTSNAAALTGNWTTISTYYQIKNYYSQASCFNKGTKILCLNRSFEEVYVPIEELRTGHLVKSYKHGYRKIEAIGRIPVLNNANQFTSCMYKMKKTETNGLIEDLIVTAGHSILVDDLKEYKEENNKIMGNTQIIDEKYLLLAGISKEFEKIEDTNVYYCYHFILENNGDDSERFGVWANGVLTETPPKHNFLKMNFILL